MRSPFVIACCAGALFVGAATDATAFKCMPLYGNWCGINYPTGGWPPPVDAFDAACMRHDLCTGGPGPDKGCDVAFVSELRTLGAQSGYLPRPLQWAEYAIRVKSGGAPWAGMPMPSPGDAFGFMSSIAAPCW